ncbi:cell division protein ZapE [Kitasatospora sp. NPDC054939]
MLELVEAAAREQGFTPDAAQRDAAERLGRLAAELSARGRLFHRSTPRGVYVWGPVGRGKSWLTGLFFDALPERHKRRVHFHEFFREFHTAYARHRGDRRACDKAVGELLGDCRVLFFDEFHVHDPGDAMIITRVLTSLLERRITLVTTSNYPPEGLLPSPVHHHLFEPAIELLRASLDVVEVAGPYDYRTRESARGTTGPGFRHGRYLSPGTDRQLRDAGLTPPAEDERTALPAGSGTVTARAVRDDLVWFDFADLCRARTSTGDYLELADRHTTWVLSGVPRLTDADRDAAQRFANLVDVLHDRDTTLYLIADAPLGDLLRGDLLPADTNRTVSRLHLLPETEPDPASASEPAPTG